jgi:hypothetical protein
LNPHNDFDLSARVAALELAFGLPRTVPMLECHQCGYVVADIRRRTKRVRDCPECGHVSLLVREHGMWPPRHGRGNA